ncbi:MAG TPA: hypothetical protein VK157_11805 [Phycisphaerales bacterium]|nr:hypothetical protein [Phycisphaerales bacterium]
MATDDRYARPTDLQRSLALPLFAQLLTLARGPFDVEQFSLISETSPEFKALKVKPHPQYLGLDPRTSPLAALVSLVPPEQIIAKFGSIDAALDIGNRVQHGAALLYGLQTSAICYKHVATAEALVRFSPQLRINFQFPRDLLELIPPDRLDQILLELTESWSNPQDAMTWNLLESHAAWSPTLSARIIAFVRARGSESRVAIWSWHGNGFADNMHPSLLQEAIDALKPHAKTERNAARWLRRLKQRQKLA